MVLPRDAPFGGSMNHSPSRPFDPQSRPTPGTPAPDPRSSPVHTLDSAFVADQLARRVVPANEQRLVPEGDYVLYWMQAYHRLDDNWAFRHAVREADRLNKPLVVHQGLDPTYPHASDRIHHFALAGARETARRAAELGVHYQFVLRRRRADDRRVVDRLASRAAVLVTDLFPTAGVRGRTLRLAERVAVRTVEVESFCVVPAAVFEKEEYAARTLRPKLAKLLDRALEPAEDRGPRRAATPALARLVAELTEVAPLDLATADLAAECAACEIDHAVPIAPLVPGRAAALARLEAFAADGLRRYGDRRRDPTDDAGTSRLSPYLHFGQVGPGEVARAVREAGPRAQAEAFLDELCTWRELAFNFCLRNPDHFRLRALPDWARRTLAEHEDDPREVTYTLAQMEHAETGDELWNAAQRELLATGQIHNMMRQVWGKSVLLWTNTYQRALEVLLHLNDRWGLDGRDPNSYANILWCFGKFDRAFQERPVWGKLRPISLARARQKFDAKTYMARWQELDLFELR